MKVKHFSCEHIWNTVIRKDLKTFVQYKHKIMNWSNIEKIIKLLVLLVLFGPGTVNEESGVAIGYRVTLATLGLNRLL